MKVVNTSGRWFRWTSAVLVLGMFFTATLCAAAQDRARSGQVNKPTKAFSSNQSVQQLPAAAKSAISAAIGRDQSAYHTVAVPNGFQTKNPQSNLQATFTRQSVQVENSAQARWEFNLAAYGQGSKLQPTSAAKPRASGNRVEYRRGALTEWYVNGPAGLEQGFTIARPPKGSKRGTLTLALDLSGNLTPALDAAKTGLVLSGNGGEAAFRYSGLTAYDATGRQLRSWLELHGNRLLVQMDATGARYPVTVDPYIQRAKLLASDGASGDELGRLLSMDADGSTVVVGANNANGTYNEQGAVYAFTKPAGGWDSGAPTQAKLTASDPAYLALLGESVSISSDGSTIAAGARGWNDFQGAVYIYLKPTGGWADATENAKLVASGGNSYDFLGGSVGISDDGSTVVAGAYQAPSVTMNSAGPGAAYVFVRPAGGWSGTVNNTAMLTASDGTAQMATTNFGDQLGISVGISGDGSTVVAGAPAWNNLQGAAYVFVRPGTAWSNATQHETAKLTASDGASQPPGATEGGDELGYAVAISGDGSTVVAGAPWNIYPAGAVYVFVSPWTGSVSSPQHQTAKLIPSDGTGMAGLSVSITDNGSKVVAAGYGTAYVFDKSGTAWSGGASETQKLTASGMPFANDADASSVGVSSDGATVAVGSPYETVNSNTNQGAAYVFSLCTDCVLFDTFDTKSLAASTGRGTFTLKGSFILGADSDGIDPATEAVTLQIGSMTLTIPSGSFSPNRKENYVYSGSVGTVSLNALISPQGANDYTFEFKGSGADLAGTTNLVPISLTIGNDIGTTSVNGRIH